MNDNLSVSFDIFSEHLATTCTPTFDSPEKRSAKRLRTDRLNPSGNVLEDITGLSGNSRLNTPTIKSSKYNSLRYYESPTKKVDSHRFVDGSHDDLFSFTLFSEETIGELDGVDLLQGFEKIGQSGKDENSPGQPLGKRSHFGPRSNTSRFN